ncbi:DEAD/DEAH box helicase [Salinicola salarius]|uniref:DEAD/DEAH box helicase n=1 Tax=Salinicola salarius TaxID=430457 RepID=UPI0023E3FC93|nr:DEAD/DEAH box helicase [Salinicola salarius]MDF3918504.1 DEAD/DEAH box helicase [Salinicola salarius]
MVDRTILRKLLEIELDNFASKMCLVNTEYKHVEYDLILSALNLLKELSNREESDFNRQVAITIVSLLWTHSDPAIKDNLRQIITPILASMGFSPSNIMLDEQLRSEGVYSPLNSYIDKLRVLIHDRKNQVSVGEIKYTLTGFQSELWQAIERNRLVGISAPTSAGKSFLIYLKIIDMLKKGACRFVYVVPTLSLISQVTSDISKLIRDHNLSGIDVLNSYEEDLTEFIYVVTQERAIALFSDDCISELDLLVVDEIQNIEKVANEGEDRSKILYDVLIDVRNDTDVDKIILSGPRLKNIGGLGFRIFGEVSEEKQTDSPPVLSLTYSVSKKKGRYLLNLYSSIFDTPLQKIVENSSHIHGLGQVRYTEKFNDYLHRTLECLEGEVNVVFSPTSSQARKSASQYAIYKQSLNDKSLNSLSSYFKDTVHSKYELARIVESGVAYHTGKTPMHVRKSIEHATSTQLVKYLFCTTTLMQGVNLPAKNVVIRNPNLFTQKKQHSVSLSAYEFANLRGRAGRLLTDFIGRTIVLDESSFDNSEEQEHGSSLFLDEYKDIKTGYQDVYEKDSGFIDYTLANDEVVEDASSKYLITHIRQMLYRHGKDKGISRLKDVGLNLAESLVDNAMKGLNGLKVERDIVISNRYWDPLDIDRLSDIYKSSSKPLATSIYEPGLYQSFLSWMIILRDEFPYYFNRYLGRVDSDMYLYGIAKSAESWVREKPLSEILHARFDSTEQYIDDKIDSEIEKLSKHVSYGLPMLLKPISDLGGQESSIIPIIEIGIHSPLARYLSDRGVPRETAIKVSRIHGNKGNVGLDNNRIKRGLNYWELQHIKHLL